MLASIVIAALPFLSAVFAVDGCSRNATVKAGDTCDAVSRKYGVPTFQLALVNEATIAENCDNLIPGENVCLGIKGQDCTKVYTVVQNDTCAWIQEMYGIQNSTLHSNNPQVDAECSNIYVGEVLCVDTNTFAYPEYNQTLYEASPDCKGGGRADDPVRPSHIPTSPFATKRVRSIPLSSAIPLRPESSSTFILHLVSSRIK